MPVFDEDAACFRVRELIDEMTLAAGLAEGEACSISAEICENLGSEYKMRAEELAED